MGLVSQVFDQEVLERMPGQLAIGHNRYSTTGSSKVCNAQPVVLMTRLWPLALAHNGNLVNAAELRDSLAPLAGEITSTTDSELIAFALQEAVDSGLGWNAAIRKAAGRCRGAFSLVIGTPDGCSPCATAMASGRWCSACWGNRSRASGWPAARPAASTSSAPASWMTCSPAS